MCSLVVLCSILLCSLIVVGSGTHPGQVFNLGLGGDLGIALLIPGKLHIPQVQHAGDDVQQLLLEKRNDIN